MATTAMIHVRVNEDLKKDATKGTRINGFICLRCHPRFPNALHVPNAETQQAMIEARDLTQARFDNSEDLFNALESE